jgi:hypothetical protein
MSENGNDRDADGAAGSVVAISGGGNDTLEAGALTGGSGGGNG